MPGRGATLRRVPRSDCPPSRSPPRRPIFLDFAANYDGMHASLLFVIPAFHGWMRERWGNEKDESFAWPAPGRHGRYLYGGSPGDGGGGDGRAAQYQPGAERRLREREPRVDGRVRRAADPGLAGDVGLRLLARREQQ